jgi:hypothetical protein
MFFRFLNKYAVLVEAENLLMDLQGVQRFGFFTTRYVRAADVEGASQRAIDLVREELLSTGSLLNERGDDPILSASEILQIDTLNGVNVPGSPCRFPPHSFVVR